ncbi:hypothetical protein OUZ56_024537 [Daphnia magna]|uniref:Uncharacterized protein n=1 Tax=Daphnia magna TaxID=35525 RepID=A0ABR0B0W6_9CRUS|nr:hypothetical protein OUZ56_024537 [Daphnia magna]
MNSNYPSGSLSDPIEFNLNLIPTSSGTSLNHSRPSTSISSLNYLLSEFEKNQKWLTTDGINGALEKFEAL